MENARRPRKALFILVWGVLGWGGGVTVFNVLFDWYSMRRIDSLSHLVIRLGLNMAMGVVVGYLLWRRHVTVSIKSTRTQIVVRVLLLVFLMLALAYVLWLMAGRID
jgi:NhaP-type Na+/H+ or K+/H+ antiporter